MKKSAASFLLHQVRRIPNASLLLAIILLSINPKLRAQYVKDSSSVSSSTSSNSEPTEEKKFSDRLVPGGNFGVGFGTQWYVDISPSLGYQINNRMVAGAGIIYNAYGGTFMGKKYLYQLYGGSVFARYRLLSNFFANTELEWLNVPYETISESSRTWIFNPLVGASYVMPFGNRGGLQVSLLYNLNYQPSLSPYPSAFVWRIGFFL